MKKTLLACILTLAVGTTAYAQDDDKMIFNHLSVGVNVGTPGIGFDVATTCTPYLQFRAGVSFFPKVKVNTSLDLSGTGINDVNRGIETVNNLLQTGGYPNRISHIGTQLDVEGKVGFTNGKILVDFFPFKSTRFPFFITVGAYFGTSSIVSVYNKQPGYFNFVYETNAALGLYNQMVSEDKQMKPVELYAELGDYKLSPDAHGDFKAEIKTSGFKPYVGIGFGRPVPKKNRVGFVFELGCQFWGKPKVYCNGIELKSDNVGSEAGDALKTISKISVYPVLNFRLCGRIF